MSASATPSGSRPTDGAQEVSTLTGFDPSRVKYISDLRAALDRQTKRADKAERQVRDLAAENIKLRTSPQTASVADEVAIVLRPYLRGVNANISNDSILAIATIAGQTAASAIEAQRAATSSGAVHESAAATAETPNGEQP